VGKCEEETGQGGPSSRRLVNDGAVCIFVLDVHADQHHSETLE